MTCLIPGIRVVAMPAPAPPGAAWMSIKTLALRTPSIVRSARSASFLIVAGTFGSFCRQRELHFYLAVVDVNGLHQSEGN